MTDPLFLGVVDGLQTGSIVELTGDEGRHAAVVKRVRVGESILVSDGLGRGVRAAVTEVTKTGLRASVSEVLTADEGPVTYRAVQALAKGDRSELAIELLTELGCDEIVAWQAHRSIVRWDGKAAKGLAKWQATAREATKQSRRLRLPVVADDVVTSKQLARDITQAPDEVVLVLHESATDHIADIELPDHGRITVIVGPEGGISAEELQLLTEAGARPVVIADAVLRASTAAAIAIAQLQVLARAGGAPSTDGEAAR